MTSNDLKPTSQKSSPEFKPIKVKKKLKFGGNFEFNEHYLDEILNINNLLMELAMQIISNDKTVRSDIVQDLKDFNSKSLATRAEKGEQLISIMPAKE